MAKSRQINGTFKFIIQIVLGTVVAAAVVWGAVRHQVDDNTDDIKIIKEVDIPAKLDKEVFQMYLDQEQKADEKTDKKLDKILDKVLEK